MNLLQLVVNITIKMDLLEYSMKVALTVSCYGGRSHLLQEENVTIG